MTRYNSNMAFLGAHYLNTYLYHCMIVNVDKLLEDKSTYTGGCARSFVDLVSYVQRDLVLMSLDPVTLRQNGVQCRERRVGG